MYKSRNHVLSISAVFILTPNRTRNGFVFLIKRGLISRADVNVLTVNKFIKVLGSYITSAAKNACSKEVVRLATSFCF